MVCQSLNGICWNFDHGLDCKTYAKGWGKNAEMKRRSRKGHLRKAGLQLSSAGNIPKSMKHHGTNIPSAPCSSRTINVVALRRNVLPKIRAALASLPATHNRQCCQAAEHFAADGLTSDVPNLQTHLGAVVLHGVKGRQLKCCLVQHIASSSRSTNVPLKSAVRPLYN